MRRGIPILILSALLARAATNAPPEDPGRIASRDPGPGAVQGSGRDEAGAEKDKEKDKEKENGEAGGKYSGSCLSDGCHADIGQLPQVHGPVAIGACEVCHQAVAGEEHSFDLAREESELCTFCHSSRPLEVRHKPFEVGSCESCHAPHGGADRNYILEGTTADSVCGECHETEEHAVAHEPYAEGRCTQCHAPHQSASAGLLRRGGGDGCLRCHERLARDLRAADSVHDPVREGTCDACHEPHGGSLPWMLTAGYPRDLYATFSEEAYELCLACHSASDLLEAASTETGFRDGDRNLHFLHVKQPEKGRSCRFCHSAHAGRGPGLIRSDVAFGNWKLPLGFEASPTGGRCATGCHRPLAYDRGGDVSSEPDGVETSSQTPRGPREDGAGEAGQADGAGEASEAAPAARPPQRE